MRIIIDSRSRYIIDFLGASRRAPSRHRQSSGHRRRARRKPSPRQTRAQTHRSPEQSLFTSLLSLLYSYRDQLESPPSRKALKAIIEGLTELLERGTIPGETPQDSGFLRKLIALVARVRATVEGPFLADTATEILNILQDNNESNLAADQPASRATDKEPGADIIPIEDHKDDPADRDDD